MTDILGGLGGIGGGVSGQKNVVLEQRVEELGHRELSDPEKPKITIRLAH